MLPSTVRDGEPRWGQARGLRHGQHMEFLSKMSISPSEAAVTVQRITMLPFRSNFPPRAYLFCCELGQCWGRSAHPALCNAEKEGFSLHTHTPFFPFFFPSPFFPLYPPPFFFSFPTPATRHQDVVPAPALLQDLLPHHQGHERLGILAGLPCQENLGGPDGRGARRELSSEEACRQNLQTQITRSSNTTS